MRAEEKTVAEEPAFLDLTEVVEKKKGYEIGKRIQDIFFGVLAAAALLPFLLFIALLIFLDDPHGSPIFCQKRVGLNGREFCFFKFRTMVADAEQQLEALAHLNEKDGPMFKIKDDPRITRFGRFLRKTGLDELPQLLNILKGDMTFVGPRPCLPKEFVCFNQYQRQKVLVKPGLTCYWQIQPERDDIPFEQWIELDIKYIRERGFLVDWKIVFATVQTVLHGNGH